LHQRRQKQQNALASWSFRGRVESDCQSAPYWLRMMQFSFSGLEIFCKLYFLWAME
jgi:hypothetical protein